MVFFSPASLLLFFKIAYVNEFLILNSLLQIELSFLENLSWRKTLYSITFPFQKTLFRVAWEKIIMNLAGLGGISVDPLWKALYSWGKKSRTIEKPPLNFAHVGLWGAVFPLAVSRFRALEVGENIRKHLSMYKRFCLFFNCFFKNFKISVFHLIINPGGKYQ